MLKQVLSNTLFAPDISCATWAHGDFRGKKSGGKDLFLLNLQPNFEKGSGLDRIKRRE